MKFYIFFKHIGYDAAVKIQKGVASSNELAKKNKRSVANEAFHASQAGKEAPDPDVLYPEDFPNVLFGIENEKSQPMVAVKKRQPMTKQEREVRKAKFDQKRKDLSEQARKLHEAQASRKQNTKALPSVNLAIEAAKLKKTKKATIPSNEKPENNKLKQSRAKAIPKNPLNFSVPSFDPIAVSDPFAESEPLSQQGPLLDRSMGFESLNLAGNQEFIGALEKVLNNFGTKLIDRVGQAFQLALRPFVEDLQAGPSSRGRARGRARPEVSTHEPDYYRSLIFQGTVRPLHLILPKVNFPLQEPDQFEELEQALNMSDGQVGQEIVRFIFFN